MSGEQSVAEDKFERITLHGNNIRPTGEYSCHLQSTFDTLRPRIPEEEGIQRWVRHQRKKLLNQL
jgi:hypothetical protein